MYVFYKHADTLWQEWSSRLEVLYFHQQHRLFLWHNLHVGTGRILLFSSWLKPKYCHTGEGQEAVPFFNHNSATSTFVAATNLVLIGWSATSPRYFHPVKSSLFIIINILSRQNWFNWFWVGCFFSFYFNQNKKKKKMKILLNLLYCYLIVFLLFIVCWVTDAWKMLQSLFTSLSCGQLFCSYNYHVMSCLLYINTCIHEYSGASL